MAAIFKSVISTPVCLLGRKAVLRYLAMRLLSFESQEKERNTHFGYETVTEEEKTQKGENTSFVIG